MNQKQWRQWSHDVWVGGKFGKRSNIAQAAGDDARRAAEKAARPRSLVVPKSPSVSLPVAVSAPVYRDNPPAPMGPVSTPWGAERTSEPSRRSSSGRGFLLLVFLIAVGYLWFRAVSPGVQESTPAGKTTTSTARVPPDSARPAGRGRASETREPSQVVPADSSSTAPQTPTKNAASIAPAEMTFTATHKHRLRDCHGVLTLSKRSIRYDADKVEDSFEFALADVSLHENGIEAGGKRWHFDIDGQRVPELFRNWKTGVLFR
jgi:hypothetical protein